MARVNILNQAVLDASVITGNGPFRIFESGKIDSPNSENALEVVIEYKGNLPDPEQGGTNYRISALIETEDNAGNWHPIHYQYTPFVKEEQGNKHILRLDPTIFNLDEGVGNAISDGFNIVALESKKQGLLPDDFRIAIVVHENGFGTPGAFASVVVTASHYTYAA